jgi:hypothetical protein
MPNARLLPLLLLAGCATAGEAPLPPSTGGPSTTQVQTSSGIHTLSAVPDPVGGGYALPVPEARVWASLPRAFARLEITPAGSIQGATRSYGNPSLRASRRLAGEPVSRSLSCGRTPIGAPAADAHPVEVAVVATIAAAGEGMTTVRVHVQGVASPTAGGTRIDCVTTGRLEARLVEELAALNARSDAGTPGGS